MTTFKNNYEFTNIKLNLFNNIFIVRTNRTFPLITCLDATYCRNYEQIRSIDTVDKPFVLKINHGNSIISHNKNNSNLKNLIELEPGIFLEFNEDSRSFSICLPDNSDRSTLRLILSATSAFIQLSLLRNNIYFIHASAASIRNHGIVFSGPNESGKSSLLRSILKKGAIYLSDDSCPISTNSGKPIIIPNPEAITCTEMNPNEIQTLQKHGFSYANDNRFLTPPIHSSEPAEVNFIFFPQIVKGKQRIVSLTKMEAALKLLKSVKTPLSDSEQEHWFNIACDICEKTEAAIIFIEHESIFNAKELIDYCG